MTADYDREREMAEREEKRKLFTVLTQDNAIGVVESRKIFDRFRCVADDSGLTVLAED